MGDGRLSTETAADVLDGTELIEVTQGGNTRVTTAQEIGELGGTGGGIDSNTVIESTSPVVSAGFGGALAYLSAADTAVNASATISYSWDAVEYDTDSFWSAGNPSRMTVPVGVARVKLTASFNLADLTADSIINLTFFKNGASFNARSFQTSGDTSGSSLTHSINAVTAALEVVAGDYFEARLYCDDTSITVNEDASIFAIEVVEWDNGSLPAYEVYVPPRFGGATLSMTSDKTAQNYSTGAALSWDQAVFDSHSFWSASTPTRLTIPAGVKKVRLNAGFRAQLVAADSIVSITFKKNGAPFTEGRTGQYSGDTSSTDLVHTVSAVTGILEVVEGDYFEASAYVNDTSITVEYDGGTTFSIEVVEWDSNTLPGYNLQAIPPFGGAALELTADDTGVDATSGYEVSWGQAVYDSNSFWSAGSPILITIPAGVLKVRFVGNINISANTNNSYVSINFRKNGTGLFEQNSISTNSANGSTNWSGTIVTPPIEVSEGDYFALAVFTHASETSITIEKESTNLSVEVVEWDTDYSRVHNLAIQAPFGGALVNLTSDDTAVDASSGVQVSWDATVYDTESFWSASNPTRLTVPSGVSRVRLIGGVRLDLIAADSNVHLSVYKNGGNFDGRPIQSEGKANGTVTDNYQTVSSPPLEVVAGDYFELRLTCTDTSVTISSVAGTFFAIEVVEWDATQYPTSNAVLAVQTKTDVETFDALPGVCYLVSTAATSGNEDVLVDLAAPVTGGDRIGIKYVSAEGSGESVVINPSSAQDIDGSTADITLHNPGEYIELISAGDGVNWYIVSRVT